MKKVLVLSIIIVCAINSSLLQGMLTPILRRSAQLKNVRMPLQKSPFITGVQKRTLYTPESMKQLSQLPKEVRIVSPVHGIAKKESGVLEKMYAVKSDSPALAVKLVQSLFHLVGNQFGPSRHITNPVCALTSGILGLVIGAAEKNQLENPQVRIYITNEWRTEYEKIITETKRADGSIRSAKEVTKLMNVIDDKIDAELTIINDEYKNDKNSGRSILLAFFALKADLTSDHDMIHYLSGINRFLPIVADQSEAKTPVLNMSLLERLKKFAQTLREHIAGSTDRESVLLNQKNYTQKDYAYFKNKAKEIKPSETMDFALENFELAISTILNEKRGVGVSLYPPKVVRNMYGYQGQHERSNCVETAFQDLFNILLYDNKTQSFDISLLPVNISLNEAFKKFYEDYKDINQINSREVGQAFMDLVSNISGVDYFQQKNYELNANADNFLIIANHLLGTQARDLNELGTILSDERRTITFILHFSGKENITKISMVIKDNKTNAELRADLGFAPGHGEISVEEREQSNISLLDPAILAKNYSISPEAQALFSIQPPSIDFMRKNLVDDNNLPVSFYYTLNAEGDWDKSFIIKKILHSKIPNRPHA